MEVDGKKASTRHQLIYNKTKTTIASGNVGKDKRRGRVPPPPLSLPTVPLFFERAANIFRAARLLLGEQPNSPRRQSRLVRQRLSPAFFPISLRGASFKIHLRLLVVFLFVSWGLVRLASSACFFVVGRRLLSLARPGSREDVFRCGPVALSFSPCLCLGRELAEDRRRGSLA